MSIKIESPVDPIDHDAGKTSRQANYDRARRAIAHFYRIRPNLEAFARVFTKDKNMRIEPTSGASATDGKGTIWLKVNIELGDEYRHDRALCDKRDARLQLKCSACLTRENMLVALFHEIAHNVYESFEAMSDDDKETAVKEALAEAERFGIKGRRLESIRQKMEERPPSTYGEAAQRISPYLFPLINGLEDARINALTMRARKGMRPMFEARTLRIFGDGIETDDGRVIHWRNQPGNAQMAVAMSCFASNTYESDWFADDVAEAMADPKLQRLVMSAVQTDSAAEVYRHGFPILEKLRELGFYRTPEDEPDDEVDAGADAGEPDDEDTGGDHDQSEEGDGDGSTGEPSDEDSDTEPSTEPTDDPSGADSEGEPTEPDEEYEDDGPSGAFEFDDPDDGDLDGDEADDGDLDGDEADEADEADDGEGGAAQSDQSDAEPDPDAEPEPAQSDQSDAEPEPAQSDPDAEPEPEPEPDGPGGIGTDGDDEPEPPEQEGTPDEVEAALATLCSHGEVSDEQPEDDDIKTAIVQERDFDAPSANVLGCNVIAYGERDEMGQTVFDPIQGRAHWAFEPLPESIIQQSLIRMRVAFSENRRGKKERNLRTGKVNGKALGRVAVGDDRVFQKRTRPGKRDYFVVIGLDLSGSTASGAIRQIKSAAFAQAELLNRIGVDFEIWGHTGSLASTKGGTSGYGRYISCDLYKVKGVDERWSTQTKERLEALVPGQANLDGHTMEFYRKRLDASRATDRLLMYYTDGNMPAENGAEEKVILERELRECKRRGYEVVGVGIGTDSPKKYGMDTVIINSVRDVPEVVKELHKRLT